MFGTINEDLTKVVEIDEDDYDSEYTSDDTEEEETKELEEKDKNFFYIWYDKEDRLAFCNIWLRKDIT